MKRMTALVLTWIAAMIGLLAVAAPAQAANPYGPEYINGSSGKCLDLTEANPTPGTPVQQWRCLGNPNQAWKNVSGISGVWKGKNVGSGTCIDGYAGRGSQLSGHTCDSSSDQRFTVHPEGRYFRFESQRWPGQCIDLFEWNPDDGAVVGLWDCNGSSAQLWGG